MRDPIDVIIPVYKGLEETRNCIESVLRAKNLHATEIVVLDDCSPEPELSRYLATLAVRGEISLLINKENLGFVRTVNRGMGLHPDRDVVLLNSDTVVNGDWIDRLHACAQRDSRIATVTPFSNNATICSYPRYCEANPLPEGWAAEALDRAFAEINAGQSVEVPTAVGFCMMIRRTALRELGLFDYESFGKGYGEENDFCMRAIKAGMRNVLSADTYVLHVGNVSFGPFQQARMAAASQALLKKHPDYDQRVHRHFVEDPARPYRLAVDAYRWQMSPQRKLLFISHNLGGGTAKHVQDLAVSAHEGAEVLLLLPVPGTNTVELSWLDAHEAFKLYFKLPMQYDDLVTILRSLRIDRIHIHHTLGLDSSIWELPRRLSIPYDFTAHDFFSFCPRIHLSRPGDRGTYCGEPDQEGCRRCLNRTPRIETSIRTWRDVYRSLLEGAERVITPSLDAAHKLRRHFPDARILAAPHPDSEAEALTLTPLPPRLAHDETLRIVALGTLDEKKGRDVLLQTAKLAASEDVHFHLCGALHPAGASAGNLISTRLTVHGPYAGDRALQDLLTQIRPHLIWFPSLVPETYSYTLSAALRARLPVVATNLGSFPERLAGRPWTWIRPWRTSAADWVRFFAEVKTIHFASDSPPVPPPAASITEQLLTGWYRSNYLVAKATRAPTLTPTLNATQLHPLAYPPPSGGPLRTFLTRLRRIGIVSFAERHAPHQFKRALKNWLAP